MKTTRILISSEWASYREVLAEAFRTFHPEVEVFEVESYDLDRKVERLRPDLLICSRATTGVKKNVPVWVELYPDGDSRSLVSVSGRRKEIEGIELLELISLAEKAETLARKRGEKSPGRCGPAEGATTA